MSNVMTLYKKRALCSLGLAVLLSACATGSPPTEQLAVSNAAVTDAVSAGATELAPAELSSARDKINRANSAVEKKDYKVAERLATEAEADARLAQNKASAVRAQKSASVVQDGTRVLQEEMNRKSQ